MSDDDLIARGKAIAESGTYAPPHYPDRYGVNGAEYVIDNREPPPEAWERLEPPAGITPQNNSATPQSRTST
jgi:hypothetical protein